MQERTNWTPIKNYEGLYEINELGQIRSLTKKYYHILLKSRIDRGGYMTVRLRKKGKGSTCLVHRLIAIAFVPNPRNSKYVNHINGIKLDNSISNLEWVTHQENIIHAYQKGLSSAAKRVVDSITGKVYYSIREAAESIDINYNTCCKLLKAKKAFRLSYFR